MKLFFLIIIIFIYSFSLSSREAGQTEITTEEGIEVFQDEKYYLLKKNVKIISDNFTLFGDKVKIFFNNDLYDIKKIDAFKNVSLDSIEYKLKARGERLIFVIESEEIYIEGLNSQLNTNDAKMFSDGEIKVNNTKESFFIILNDVFCIIFRHAFSWIINSIHEHSIRWFNRNTIYFFFL